MPLSRFVAWVFSLGMIISAVSIVSGQDFPNKPIRIVTSGIGGNNDAAARLIALWLTTNMGQQVVVENRPGASGIIAAQTVSSAPPDGYTLLLYSGSIWTLPYLQSNVPYDPVRDFSPVVLLSRAPSILVVHPSLPVRSVKELIALAKAKPGMLNNASGESGSTQHLASVLFASMAGVDIVNIPYKSVAMRMADVLGGQVQLMFASSGSVSTYVKSGRLRALAVTSAQPSALFPSVPTVAASGLPGYESVSSTGMFAPAKTPAAIINRLNQEIVRILNRADVKEWVFNSGAETVGSSPEDFAVTMKADMSRMRKVIEEGRIRAD